MCGFSSPAPAPAPAPEPVKAESTYDPKAALAARRGAAAAKSLESESLLPSGQLGPSGA